MKGIYSPVLAHLNLFVEVMSASAHQVKAYLLLRGFFLVYPLTAHHPHSLVLGDCSPLETVQQTN